MRTLLIGGGLLLVAAAAFAWMATFAPRAPHDGGQTGEPLYRPLDLPPDITMTLRVRDLAWPMPNPLPDPARFTGEAGVSWFDHVEEAVAAFRRRYPNVTVVVERPEEPGREHAEAGAPAAGGERPDIVALWWGEPWPGVEQVVPVDPYLTDDQIAAYHPLAWNLVTLQGQTLAWPRWIAFHYWLGRGAAEDWTQVVEQGWRLPEAAAWLDRASLELLDAAEAGVPWLGPPRSGALLMEWLSEDAVLEEGVLASALDVWQPHIAAGDASGSRARLLATRSFLLAGGLSPVLAKWALAPALSGVEPALRGERALTLLPPPSLSEPQRVPVVSAGAYAVLRKHGEREPERAQLAMELAALLTRHRQSLAVSRMLAFPAERANLLEWRETTDLPEEIEYRLLADASYSLTIATRPYGRLPERFAVFDPIWVESLFQAWRSEALSSSALELRLLGPLRQLPPQQSVWRSP